MSTDLILGTAGHIDHGKTSLIRALTGVDTDRLPEEKQRGITIDLGFAQLDVGAYRLGIVDVPGHKRFVRNMLAGATGMDLALLVVAADDSVKPQTREHLDILRLLDLRSGVIALTKVDLCDTDWIELVEQEVRELVVGTFLEDAPLTRVSATTGVGIEQLRSELEMAAGRAGQTRPTDPDGAPFRMAIDRAFTVAGHGTVVTGSVSSGRACLGEELSIEPGGIRVRIRGLQNHDRPAEAVWRGQRAAMNLAGVHHEQLRRGQELATPGHLRPSRLWSARIHAVEPLARPIRHRSRVRIHVGTAELTATLALLDRPELGAGQSGLAQVFLSAEAVTTWNQPFVIRSESPGRTIGGGQVLVPHATRIRRRDSGTWSKLTELSSTDPVRRAGTALYFAGLNPWRVEDLAADAGILDPSALLPTLRAKGTLHELVISPTRTLRFHAEILEQLCRKVETALAKLHQRDPLQVEFDRAQLRKAFPRTEPAMLDLALSTLIRAGRARESDRGIALDGYGPKLSPNEQKLLARIVAEYRQAGLEAPSVREVQQRADKNRHVVPQLIALATANGDLVEITPDYFLHHEVDQDARRRLARAFSAQPGLTVSQIREILNTSRKYAVPYCEHLDRVGFTQRTGDVRVLAEPSVP
jgi:selenocysteine-specific elongation factor